MATQLFLVNVIADTHLGTDNANLLGTNVGWQSALLRTTRGSGVAASSSIATVTGPTDGIEMVAPVLEFISNPISADVTIAGTITGNIWASESNMSANVSICMVVEVIRANATATRNSNTIVEIGRRAPGTEIALTTRAVNNFTITPTSTVVNRGDRLRVRIFGDDVTGGVNMATGFTFNYSFNGSGAAADGDTYVTFTENFSFESAPAGSVLYLTGTASDVASADIDDIAWTSRGAGVQTLSTNTATGWTAPIQVPSGTAASWFTPQLTAFTLTGMAVANIRAAESNLAANASLRCEIARVDSDGTNATVWASWCIAPTGADNGELTASEVARTANVSGDDLAFTDGQRIRIRLYVEDISSAALVTGHTVTVYYDGTSGGASGDSYVTLPVAVTEFSAGPAASFLLPNRNLVITRR